MGGTLGVGSGNYWQQKKRRKKKKMWFCVNIIDLGKCTGIYNKTQYVDLKGSHHTPNFHNFDDVILNLHIDYYHTLLTVFVFQLLVYLPLASFFFYYYLSPYT